MGRLFDDKPGAVSHRPQSGQDGGIGPGKQTLVDRLHPSGVQQRAGGGPAEVEVHDAAAHGVATPSSPLPYADRIQRLFGAHDVSSIQAHVGSDAAASAHAMGAEAYATGNHVVLGGGADLHTVAHEAAHVVQQRGGVQLKGGVGEAGDVYERHADEVAGRVVRGESAEDLLGGPAKVDPSGGRATAVAPSAQALDRVGAVAGGPAVQRFGHSSHRHDVVHGLKDSYTKEQLGKIYAANFERDFAQVPAPLADLVLAWKDWKHDGFAPGKQAPFMVALGAIMVKMRSPEDIVKLYHAARPYGGSKAVEHVDDPGGEQKKHPSSGLPENIHESREYIKQHMRDAFKAAVTGQHKAEDTRHTRSRKIIEAETKDEIDRVDQSTPQKTGSRHMSRAEELNWNVIGGHLGRATHACEDFFSHSNWVEKVIYDKRQILMKNSATVTSFSWLRWRQEVDVHEVVMSDEVKTYGQMDLFTGTFDMPDQIEACADKVRGLIGELSDARLVDPSFPADLILSELERLLKDVTGAATLVSKLAAKKTSHARLNKDSPPVQDIDRRFSNAMRMAVLADQEIFGRFSLALSHKDRAVMERQLKRVDQLIASPGPDHPLWKHVDEGKMHVRNDKIVFE